MLVISFPSLTTVIALSLCIVHARPFKRFITVYKTLPRIDNFQHYHIFFTWVAAHAESPAVKTQERMLTFILFCFCKILAPQCPSDYHLFSQHSTSWASAYLVIHLCSFSTMLCVSCTFINFSLKIKKMLFFWTLTPNRRPNFLRVWYTAYMWLYVFILYAALHPCPLFSNRAWWTSRQYQSTRWQQCRSRASFCCTTVCLRPCGTGSSCWLPSTWLSPCPTTSASRPTTTLSQLRAPPSSATSWWKCSSS